MTAPEKRREDSEAPTVMYRDLDDTLKTFIRNMCNWGFIYIGRTGVGLTYSFKKEYFTKSGKAFNEARAYLSDSEIELLEVVAFEGPKWVPYTRLEEVAYRTTTRTTSPRHWGSQEKQEQRLVTKQEQQEQEERTKK